MKPGPLLCALLFAGVAPPRLAAQSLADVCKAVITTKVGQWASYDATGGRSGGGKLRLAIVGTERAGDSTLYWFEMSFAAKDPSRSAILQLLTAGLGTTDARARAVIVKSGGQPAMKVSGAMADMLSTGLGRNNPAADWTARCTATHVVGWESVTVPAGTFRALHATSDSGGEAWASPEVPFGFVKIHGKDGDLTLTGRGLDAKTSLTETPLDMPMLPGMMRKP
jgi:hypothetical protein